MNGKDTLIRLFEETSLPLTDGQADQLMHYYRMLEEKNRVMNLTAVTGFEDVCIRHFLDSAMLLSYKSDWLLKDGSGQKQSKKTDTDEQWRSLIDIGTGAGFPGIPLKILMPELDVTLLDSLGKRIGFLDEVIEACGLSGIRTVQARAEDAAKEGSEDGKNHREAYDLAVSRAVAYLPVLSEYCLPFVKTGGLFIAYKSGDVEEELKASGEAFKILGGELETVRRFDLPDGSSRTLVMVRKTGKTPDKYPRRAKKIAKEPL